MCNGLLCGIRTFTGDPGLTTSGFNLYKRYWAKIVAKWSEKKWWWYLYRERSILGCVLWILSDECAECSNCLTVQGKYLASKELNTNGPDLKARVCFILKFPVDRLLEFDLYGSLRWMGRRLFILVIHHLQNTKRDRAICEHFLPLANEVLGR